MEQTFFSELQFRQIEKIDLQLNCSILAAVGDNMVSRPGVAGRFLSALGRSGVNIRAIAQGSSERNISVVIEGLHATRALRAVHSAFYLSNHSLSIGLIGTGGIGRTFLKQLNESAERLKAEFHIDLRIRGLMTSKKMLLQDQAIDLNTWEENLEKNGEPVDPTAFQKHIRAEHLPHAVIMDCTASTELPELCLQWLEAGIHIITPNKKANTLSMDFYRQLKAASRKSASHYLYETTVGAGLPIINTLRDLVLTGDRILKIEGVFSGTLSYIFNSLSADKSFSQVVKEAKALGYTEPDPREDLSGLDVARKLVILGREMGLSLELEDVEVETLVPALLKHASLDDFMNQLPAHDEAMLKKWQASHQKDEVLRYVGSINKEGLASVRLVSLAADHPFARINLTDNIVAFETTRYSDQPLIVQGPGAGPEVTAAGVFADLLRLSNYLGATL